MADDLKQLADEIKRHFDLTSESLRSEICQVAEALISVADKTDRGFGDVQREFGEVKAMIQFSHAELARRLDEHEHDITAIVLLVDPPGSDVCPVSRSARLPAAGVCVPGHRPARAAVGGLQVHPVPVSAASLGLLVGAGISTTTS